MHHLNVGIIIFVRVISKKIKIIFIHNYLRCCKIPKGYTSNSSNISDYVKIVEITSTQYYTRLAWNRLPEQKKLENDRMETASTEVASIQCRNNIEKSTGRTHRYFVDFGSQTHVKISTLKRCHNFHVDSPLKIDEISANIQRGNSTVNR